MEFRRRVDGKLMNMCPLGSFDVRAGSARWWTECIRLIVEQQSRLFADSLGAIPKKFEKNTKKILKWEHKLGICRRQYYQVRLEY